MSLKKWEDFNENNEINENMIVNAIPWESAFESYIKGQTVVANIQHHLQHSMYAEGLAMENGYKYVSYGGGCSGEDCNTSYIISPDDKIVASTEW